MIQNLTQFSVYRYEQSDLNISEKKKVQVRLALFGLIHGFCGFCKSMFITFHLIVSTQENKVEISTMNEIM